MVVNVISIAVVDKSDEGDFYAFYLTAFGSEFFLDKLIWMPDENPLFDGLGDKHFYQGLLRRGDVVLARLSGKTIDRRCPAFWIKRLGLKMIFTDSVADLP
jgi:hypothetical protein